MQHLDCNGTIIFHIASDVANVIITNVTAVKHLRKRRKPHVDGGSAKTPI